MFEKLKKMAISATLAASMIAGTVGTYVPGIKTVQAADSLSIEYTVRDYGSSTTKSGKNGESAWFLSKIDQIAVNVQGTGLSGNVMISAYAADQAGGQWTIFKDGKVSAKEVSGGSYIQGIRMYLSGELGKQYDVYYSTETYYRGAFNWAKNGQISGNTGDWGEGVIALRAKIVKKGDPAPKKSDITGVWALNDATSYPAQTIKVVKSGEEPLFDPVGLMLQKVDSDTGDAKNANGSLANAWFKVCYYPEMSDTDPAAAGKEPLRKWVFKTNDEGLLYYREQSQIKGASLDNYRDANGNSYTDCKDELFSYMVDNTKKYGLPLGTLTFQEIKAPAGYLVNEEVFTTQVTNTGAGSVVATQTATQPEDDLELRIRKVYWNQVDQRGDETADSFETPSDITFRHTGPANFTEEVTTDENGEAVLHCLKQGHHTLKEIKSKYPDAMINKVEIEFDIDEHNNITNLKGNTEKSDIQGFVKVEVADDGCIDVVMENIYKPFRLKVHKKNEKGTVLPGAEFTVYSDENLKNKVAVGVTDKNGEVEFKDLVHTKLYYVVETKAPKGYRLPLNTDGSPVVYRVKSYGSFTATSQRYKFFGYYNKNFYWGTDPKDILYVENTPDGRVLHMNIPNQTQIKLPITGSSAMILLVGVGVAAIGVAAALKRKKR